MPLARNGFRKLLTSPPVSTLAEALLPPWLTIFMVHRVMPAASGVSGTTPEFLQRCLNYLQKNNFHLLSVETAIAELLSGRTLPKKSVAFTVDDGFHDQVTTAAKIFHEFDCPSTCFLVTGLVDGDSWPWDYQLMHVAKHAQPQHIAIDIDGTAHRLTMGDEKTKSTLLKFVRQFPALSACEITAKIAAAAGVEIPHTPPPDMQPATWDSVRSAEKLGMRFGAHSVHHYILSRLDDAALRNELTQSVQRIQQECKNPSPLFCYPSGKIDEFDRRAMQIVQELGLSAAFSAEPGFLEPGRLRTYPQYRYAIPRLPLPDSLAEFELYLSWAQYLREHFHDSALAKLYR